MVSRMVLIAGGTVDLLRYGAGIALVIIALGVFVGLRSWAGKMTKSAGKPEGNDEGTGAPVESGG